MRSSSRPKASFLFPNGWAVDSFLLRLKRNAGWDFLAAADGRHVKVKPEGARGFAEIHVDKARPGSVIRLDVNAEMLEEGLDRFWIEMADHSRRYRC